MLSSILRLAFGSIFSSLTSLLTVAGVASLVAFGSYWWGRYDAYQIHKVAQLQHQVWQLEFERDFKTATDKAAELQAQEQAATEAHNARVDESIEHQIAASPNPPSCTSANFLRRLGDFK